MSYECFSLDQQGGIAHVRMSRPEKRNAMSPRFWQELPALFAAHSHGFVFGHDFNLQRLVFHLANDAFFKQAKDDQHQDLI